MNDETRETLGKSLFRQTSAFVQPEPADLQQVVVAPAKQATDSPSQQLTKLADLIEQAIWLDIDNPDLLALLQEALEIARTHA